MSAPTLSLAELESFDPGGETRGRERRFLCPLCGEGKRRDKSHRSVAVNVETGAWQCHRCQASGKIREAWTDRPQVTRQARSRMQARRLFALPPPSSEPPPAADAGEWRKQLAGLVSLTGTPGEVYLRARGLPLDVATAAGVKFSRSFYGRPACVFPIRNAAGGLVAAHGRHTDGREDPKGHDGGKKSLGVFAAVPDALAGPLVALVEGPACALTLAGLGLPTVAVMGRALPAWLAVRMFGKRVLIASDADQAGDESAAEWVVSLRAYGASVSRLRPPGGAKDWNDADRADPDGLAAFVAAALFGGDGARDTWEGEPAPSANPTFSAAPTRAGATFRDAPTRAGEASPAEVREILGTVAAVEIAPAEEGFLAFPASPTCAREATPGAADPTFSEALTRPRERQPDEWPEELLPALAWAATWEPSAGPVRVQFAPGVYATDLPTLATSLRRSMAEGPGRGRDLYGAFSADVAALWEVFGRGLEGVGSPAEAGERQAV